MPRLGEFGFLVPTADPIGLWSQLRADPPEGVVDAVAGAESVLLIYERSFSPPERSPDLPASPPDAALPGRSVDLPVAYDGPDLGEVARTLGLGTSEVARLHASGEYQVRFLGFSPGFAYLSGLDPRLDVPRLSRPRTSVPAGSVAIAAGLTAVYPQATPGGWRLIGRTDRALFDPSQAPPALLQPGDRVRFVTSESVGDYPRWRIPGLLPGGRRGPRLEVLGVGGRLTVQDLGRPGWAHAGVPRGGAADQRSAAAANARVGNSSRLALLEVTLGGCRLRLMEARRIAVTGAPCEISVDGLPARALTGLRIPAGAEIILGPASSGVHTYVAVEGGIDVEPVLGSRSCDTLSGLGPRPLAVGDVVGIGGTSGGTPSASPSPTPIPNPGALVTLAVRPGPSAASLTGLLAGSWQVAADTDRTGARLLGPPVDAPAAVPSMGMVAGVVQLPPGGQPVVLLRNHPATGGYPVVAVVDDAGVDVLAQCRPGTRIKFELSG